jgi:ankyrin repeat protein
MGISNSTLFEQQKQKINKQLLDEVQKELPIISKIEEYINYGAELNYKDSNGDTPLIWASVRGHMNVIELLLSKGANLHDKDNDGNSPIIAASQYGHKEVVELLLSKGADPNNKNIIGDSPIIRASRRGNVDIVELLLSKGADPNDKDNDGNSPIIWAIRRNNIELLKLLLSKGANIPEDIDELLQDKPEMKLIWNKWHTMIVGLAVTKDFGLDEGYEMNLAEYLGTRDPNGGKKRRKQKSKKNKKKSKKNKRKSIKRRK